jgi:hypothetical protein
MRKIKEEQDLEADLMQSVVEGNVEAVLSCLERGKDISVYMFEEILLKCKGILPLCYCDRKSKVC